MRLADTAATAGIVVGGQGVLVAMLAICVFLFVTAAPPLQPGTAGDGASTPIETGPSLDGARLDVLGDGLALLSTPAGFAVFDRAGEAVLSAPIPADESPTSAVAGAVGSGVVVSGHEDGTIRRVVAELDGRLIAESLLDEGRTLEAGVWAVPSEAERARIGSRASGGTPVALMRDADGVRAWSLRVTQADPVEVGEGAGGVDAVASAEASSRVGALLVHRADGTLALGEVRTTRRLGGGSRQRVRWRALEGAGLIERPSWAFVAGDGSSVVLVWPGRVRWWSEAGDAWDEAFPFGPEDRITAASSAPGGRTVIIGLASGALHTLRISDGDPGGASALLHSRLLRETGHAVTALGTRADGRLVSVGYDDGSAVLVHATSSKRVVRLDGPAERVVAVGHGPSGGSVWTLGEGGALSAWAVEPGYPEVSWRSLFAPVLYEGYSEARFVYQSTGSSGSEVKYSVVPLIWGTLKATIVTMLISAPLGVLAAIYSSEFLHPSWRRTIKPAVELMATLPSVVIGFVAAMVVAPWVREHLEAVLIGAVLVPVVLVVAASGWASLPVSVVRRVPGSAQLGAILLVLAVGCVMSAVAGDPAAGVLLGSGEGGISAWIEDADRPVWGAWFLVLLPAVALLFVLSRRIGGVVAADVRRRRGLGVLVLLALAAVAGSLAHEGSLGALVLYVTVAAALLGLCWGRWWLAERPTGPAPQGARGSNILVCLAALGVVSAAALAGGWLLQAVGADPRESLLGTYSQRNTLVVGVMMGFAVIPLIYTLSEDALRAVPGSLRAASYGSGATRWQTAVRVVLPVAGSGIFSACMIGLGRAVGETMIVLMATGSTPELDLNLFGGFRSLAANIAIELPEAPRGGTHYRVLFVCGLVLFLMTLVVNTTAELVRQRFRKRSAAL